MKISIVTPIYNEEKSIKIYFQAINKINYPIEDIELILVNDGSTDKSLKILEDEKKNSKLKKKIINFEKNKGWIVARETGAKEAEHKNILFLDCKCEIFPNAIKEIKKANYSPLIGNPIQKNNHIFDRFLFLIRKKLYKEKLGEKASTTFINKKNFDLMPKGTTLLFCEKDLFLSSQPKNKSSKATNDDIRLLKNIVEKKDILRSSKVKIYYNTRKTLKENIKHMLSRGPRFADYYYRPSNKMFWIINFILIASIFILYTTIKHNLYKEIILILLIGNLFVSIYLSEKIKDLLITFLLFPIFSISFFLGVIKGIFIKLKQ